MPFGRYTCGVQCKMGVSDPQGKGRFGGQTPAKTCNCILQPNSQSYAATWRIQMRGWLNLRQWTAFCQIMLVFVFKSFSFLMLGIFSDLVKQCRECQPVSWILHQIQRSIELTPTINVQVHGEIVSSMPVIMYEFSLQITASAVCVCIWKFYSMACLQPVLFQLWLFSYSYS